MLTDSSFIIGAESGVPAITVGKPGQPVLFCGPCVIESREHTLRHAQAIAGVAAQIGLPLIFKSSYDKANRTSGNSFRGLGMDEGLKILAEVRREFHVPVVSDVHSVTEVSTVASVVDVLQIPAFLCRQTDLIEAAARTGKPLLIKKGQFLAPADMQYVIQKAVAVGNKRLMACERGTTFGYRELIVDFRGFSTMRQFAPVIFDVTHSVQVMGGAGGSSSGARQFVPDLARAGAAIGVDGFFIETHENPERAPSDGPNMIPLAELPALLRDLKLLSALALETRPSSVPLPG